MLKVKLVRVLKYKSNWSGKKVIEINIIQVVKVVIDVDLKMKK